MFGKVVMSDIRFEGRVAIVTGAGRGMGREHALFLASRGAKVVVNNRSAEPAERTVAEINAAGGNAVANIADISVREQARSAVDAAIDSFGRIDIVVNNAGNAFVQRFEESSEALVQVLNTHVWGSWWVTQAAWPHMIKQKYGRVVVITSAAGLFGVQNQTAYATGKAALVGLVRSLACEGELNGICVNALQASADTDMTRNAISDPAYQAWKKATQPAWTTSRAVAVLAHEDCEVSGGLFCVVGRRMSEFFVAETRGYTNIKDFTDENVRNNFRAVRDQKDYAVHRNGEEFMKFTGQQLGSVFTGSWMSPDDEANQ